MSLLMVLGFYELHVHSVVCIMECMRGVQDGEGEIHFPGG